MDNDDFLQEIIAQFAEAKRNEYRIASFSFVSW